MKYVYKEGHSVQQLSYLTIAKKVRFRDPVHSTSYTSITHLDIYTMMMNVLKSSHVPGDEFNSVRNMFKQTAANEKIRSEILISLESNALFTYGFCLCFVWVQYQEKDANLRCVYICDFIKH
jgi:hypothetical protein